MKSINVRHIILMEVLLIASIFVWKVTEVRYDVGVYDVLVNTNFIGTILLILISSISFLYAVLRRLSRGILLFFLTFYMFLGFLAPYIANIPYYFHRDVYLHLPYSLAIVRTGRIPLYADRWDVLSFPGAFVLYSIFMEVTGIDSIDVIGIFMAVNYVIIFAVIMIFFIGFSHRTWRINEDHALMIAISLLSFIARYAPRPAFPFRFHFAYLQSLLYTALFIALVENSVTRVRSVAVCLALIYLSITFTHPFFSLYILIASLLYMVVSFMLTRLYILFRRDKTIVALLLASIIIIFLIHVSYVVAIPLLRQAYSLVFKFEAIPRFFETSIPVNIKSQDIFAQLLATIMRFLWRAIVLITISYAMVLILMNLTRKSVPVLGISFGATAIAISTPLIISFLWWERSLTIIGMASVIALYEALRILLEKGLSKRLSNILARILLIIAALSIVISPLTTWERPIFSDNWHGMENTLFLKTIAQRIPSPYIYIGVHSDIEFTYHKVMSSETTSSKNVFDLLRQIFYENPCDMSYPYAVSQRDPDYGFLNIKELTSCRGIVWNSGVSYVFR